MRYRTIGAKLHPIVQERCRYLRQSRLTDDLHREKQTGASGHVGDHAAVMATVFRPDFLDLQVLAPRQALDATAQLVVGKNKDSVRISTGFLTRGPVEISSVQYLHLGLVLEPLNLRSWVTVSQALQGEVSVNRHRQSSHFIRAEEGRWDWDKKTAVVK